MEGDRRDARNLIGLLGCSLFYDAERVLPGNTPDSCPVGSLSHRVMTVIRGLPRVSCHQPQEPCNIINAAHTAAVVKSADVSFLPAARPQ